MSNKIQTAVIPADKVLGKEAFERLLQELETQNSLLKEYNKNIAVIRKNKKMLEEAIKNGLENVDGQKMIVNDRLLILKETIKETKKANLELLEELFPDAYERVVTITTKIEKKLSNTKIKGVE